jgi:hypoxanthine phosphoribosyltransferase
MTLTINKDIDCVLIGEHEIDQIVSELADEFNKKYAYVDGEINKLLVICVLKGAVMFMTDLVRKLTAPLTIEFMQVSSYGSSSTSSGKLIIKLDLPASYDLSEYDVLIVEDIIDSGNTLKQLTENLKERGARSVTTCVMLDKPSRRVIEYTPNYIGKKIPDVFVVGYGLDFDEKYRYLPYVGVLKPSAYEK